MHFSNNNYRPFVKKKRIQHNFLNGRYKGTAQTIANKLNSERSKYHLVNGSD